ncbi:MAG: FG-GAP repeat domain-containing protein, partial [Planctomycetota bacterium]
MSPKHLIATVALLTATIGCSRGTDPTATSTKAPPPDGPAWFEDTAVAAGIDFTWHSGFAGRHHMPESIGGGAALFDMDGDGDLDAYLVQAGDSTKPADTYEPNRLYENLGDGTFQDVTEGSGAAHRGYGMGVACGDVDDDGDVDLYVTNVGPNVLLLNLGDGRFVDATAAAGVGHPGLGTGATFLDYDADGDLDLFVLNYLNWSVETEIDCYNTMSMPDYCLPANYASPARDVLYRNDGGAGFTDVTDAAGMSSGVATGL